MIRDLEIFIGKIPYFMQENITFLVTCILSNVGIF